MVDPGIVAKARALGTLCIGTWSGKAAAPTPDDQYWEGGQWVAGLPLPAPKPAYRQGGPAFAAAAIRRWEREFLPPASMNPYLRAIAEQTVDWALGADGRAQIGWCGTGDVDPIETMMFAQDLGTVIVLLEGDTAPAKLDVWKAALREAADYLVAAGHAAWYANGNINLGYALVTYLARRVLGDAKYDWRALLQFAEAPTQHSGSGGVPYGFKEEEPAWLSWATGGAGYFTEQKLAGWPNGYDGEYTMVQLDVLARLAVLSGDARVLELTNMLLNKTLQRTNLETWMVDCGAGTRHTSPAWNRVLTSPVLHVVEAAGRAVPLAAREAQWAVVEAEFKSTAILQRPNVVYYKGLGAWVALIVVQDLVQQGVVARLAP